MTADSSIDYRPVVFRDRAAGYAFLTRSTATSDTTIEWDDGNSYPVVDVEISSESHPFYTGKARTVDTEGRIAAFERKYGAGDGDGESGRATSGVTPDALLHSSPDGEVSAEDLVLASGRDVTPESLEWARRRLAERGRAAVEEQLP